MSDDTNQIDPEDVTLTEALLGYNILVNGEYAGIIEGMPGKIQHIEIAVNWRGKGVTRAALNEFITLTRAHGIPKVTTNSPVNPTICS